jgi:hypothetical protein
VSYPLPDLIFKNDSPHGVLIDTSYTGTSITVTFWGTKRFDEIRSVTGPKTRLRDFETEYVDRPDCTATSGEQGFDITVTRVFVAQGQEVRREPFNTRYKPSRASSAASRPQRARPPRPPRRRLPLQPLRRHRPPLRRHPPTAAEPAALSKIIGTSAPRGCARSPENLA